MDLIEHKEDLWVPMAVGALLDIDEPEYNWVVPGLLERGDRVILVGQEGKGKSMLLRQMGWQIASGIVPFSLEPMEPKRVLIIDLENSRLQLKRSLINFTERGHPAPENLFTLCIPEGVELLKGSDPLGIQTALALVNPDVAIIGPMYKLTVGTLGLEEVSTVLARQLDRWRTQFQCAIILEAHQPQEQMSPSGKYRRMSPFGSSLWLRWPEFGMVLWDEGKITHWRGQREERDWPAQLYWGDVWPWEAGIAKCTQCGKALNPDQLKFCSVECGNANRQSRYRARRRGAQ